uniref:Glycosyltransferase 2-like domain-containing protein n=1 Tax=Aureoumbra lagunensis TaxID=44058 RepID=A0A7S3JTK2_9STRA|mmetsp:Transcript_464/g.653  ORF Transcript_464/g.653 Transcript_464/m.653 type:complete len:314 (+) Transcript_464:741-1682(+)
MELISTGLTVCVQTLMLLQVGFTYIWLRLRYSIGKREPSLLLEDEERINAIISVIIPAYKERGRIGSTLRRVQSAAENTELLEIIVADGGSDDGTIEEVRETSLNCKITHASGGRGPAVAAGARLATGSILLILHADTQLPKHYDKVIRHALTDKKNVATAFRFGVDRQTIPDNICTWPFRIMEFTVNIRSGLFQLPFGDQAIALPKSYFIQLGGLDDLAKVPMLEDFILVQRLRRFNFSFFFFPYSYQIKLLPLTALCHARRWSTGSASVWKINLLNQAIMLLHTFAGYSPNQIYKLYYGRDPLLPTLSSTS